MSEPPNTLPPLYARWFEEMMGSPAPAEPRVTCGDCPMCPDGDGKPRNVGVSFNPAVKCCTYWPRLPNFLVGAILSDPDPSPVAAAGRASVGARIDAQRTVTPFGLGRPLDVPGLESDHQAMGRSERLRCPHYVDEDGGLCGIWNHRHAVCATWFCKHERGAAGFRAWNALQELQLAVENELAVWCAKKLDVGGDALVALMSHAQRQAELDAPDASVWAARWGNWTGREREFFVQCHRLVDDLSWSEALGFAGSVTAVREEIVRGAFERAAERRIPERLQAGAHQTISTGADGSLAVTYSRFNPIFLPTLMKSVLHYFDGRPTDETLATIKAERGLEISPDLLQMLVDYGVLTEPSMTSDSTANAAPAAPE